MPLIAKITPHSVLLPLSIINFNDLQKSFYIQHFNRFFESSIFFSKQELNSHHVLLYLFVNHINSVTDSLPPPLLYLGLQLAQPTIYLSHQITVLMWVHQQLFQLFASVHRSRVTFLTFRPQPRHCNTKRESAGKGGPTHMLTDAKRLQTTGTSVNYWELLLSSLKTKWSLK